MINIQPVPALMAQYQPASGTLPAPAVATDGADITKWNVGYQNGRMSYDAATVYIQAAAGATLTGPVNVWGFRAVDANNAQLGGAGTLVQGVVGWYLLGTLDGGATLTITSATQGLARRIDEVSIFTRLAISCATVSNVQYSVTFEPIAVRYD